jgi:hypothetical protein
MQYLNDDNMDELFRRAASDYPLKTNADDWDKLAASMKTEDPDDDSQHTNRKKSYRKYLWLLLLLPIVWICNGKLFMNDSKQNDEEPTVKQSQNPATPAEINSKKQENKNSVIDSAKLSNTKKASLAESAASVPAENSPKSNLPLQFSDDAVVAKPDKTNNKSNLHNRTLKITDGTVNGQLTFIPDKSHQENSSALTQMKDNKAGDMELKGNPDMENKAGIAAGDENKRDLPLEHISSADSSKTLKAIKPANPDSSQKPLANQGAKKSLPNKSNIHFFYAGVNGGFDVSTVEFQSVKNTGYSAGILLGYQLSRKLSVESGLQLDKKFYYTDGKYFSTKNLYLQPGISILEASGNCYMFELPINFKYNWTSTAKSNWFTTLGMSSYFMKNEKYDYTVDYWGSPYNVARSYPNTSTSWFGAINLSGGYTHTLGNVGSLRVEPYIKIPIQGLGIGNLSIWSSGIYVTFIKKLF